MAAAVVNVDAQTSRITITKDFCASIGETNTCNGIPADFPDEVEFTVETGTYNIATGEFTVGGSSPNVDVAIQQNANGSYDVYFGPEAPEGKKGNWLQTVSGKSWFPLLRMYGPLEPWINKTWRPSEIELVK